MFHNETNSIFKNVIATKSTHSSGLAIAEFAKQQYVEDCNVTDVLEIAGLGLKGFVDGKKIFVGNAALMKKYNILFDVAIETIPFTFILVAIN